MAGLGRKTWSAGEVATAANIQGYLQDQTVMKFANIAAAGSALGTAVSEGMTAYLSDTDEQVMYNGTSWFKQNGTTNAIINGAFDINQRSFTSSTTDGAFNFDRWRQTCADGTSTYSAQSLTPGNTIAGYEFDKYLRIVTTGQTLTSAQTRISQTIEDVRTFAGQTITISFWAKAASGTPKVALEYNQNFGSGGSATVNNAIGTVTLSTSWVRYTTTYTVPSISGKTVGTSSYTNFVAWVSAGSDFNSRASSIGIQSNTFEFVGFQIEAGAVATAFKRNAPSIQAELAACQRYYWRTTNSSQYSIHGLGFANSTTNARILVKNPVTLRTSPTAVEWGNLQVSDYTTGFTPSSIVLTSAACSGEVTSLDAACTGLTQFRPYVLWNPNNTAGYIGISAEL